MTDNCSFGSCGDCLSCVVQKLDDALDRISALEAQVGEWERTE